MKQEDVFSLGKAMNELSKYAARKLRFIQQSKANLRCITGRGLEAVDLMHYRISKRLISKRSSAKLKLVG